MAVRISRPPTIEPVTLDEVKAHLKAEWTDDDALITALITAAREAAEGFQRRAYITQTHELTLDSWPAGVIRLPLPPLQTVESISYRDVTGSELVVPPSDYVVDAKEEPGRIMLAPGKSWPPANLWPLSAISIRFTAGYGSEPAAVPRKVRQAMLLMIGHWYEHREEVNIGNIVNQMPMAAESLLWQDRCW